ncbi:MAG TPA: energy transducer TonB [Candidatus Eisenbacteria bacterium]|nr:energy transducer TonB [Candidatus Eisenbacteria bacterium]
MNLPSPGSVLFSSLPKWQVPRSQFLVSYGLQAVIIALFFWVPVLTPQVLESKKDYHAIELVPTPVPESHEAQKQLAKPVLAAKLERMEPAPAAIRVAAPRPQPIPEAADTAVPTVNITSRKLDPLPTPMPTLPKQIVRTNLFSSGSSAPQTIERPAQEVQTGGFGDPNGVPARSTQSRAVNIAQAGGFDLPSGVGIGNGTGGANGVRGVVASAGFGSGVATSDARSATTAVVTQAGFGNNEVVASPASRERSAQAPIAKTIPAEILSKPVPTYTDDARAKRIEGEVLLEVVFEASGRLHVLRVVHGLGHGLDESAVHAAEQIRFKPALRDGQPSDSTVVVHIIFQLA